MDAVVYRLSIPFAIAAGAGAGLLATVARDVRRESPYGTGLSLLALVMAVATVYHGGLLVAGSETPVLQSLLVLGYVLVAAALVALVSGLRESSPGDAPDGKNLIVVTLAGLLLYAVGGPLSEVFLPSALHWVHGVASLCAVGGLYVPVRQNLRRERDDPLVGNDERRPEWMVPMDGAILGVLASSGLVLTPAVVAYNAGYSREEVNRRLRELEAEGLVERVDRGKYRIADRGTRYADGDLEIDR